MGYDLPASSVADSVPVELFLFRYGAGEDDVYAYTNSERPFAITHQEGGSATVYTPVAISRSDITESGAMDKKEVSVRVPASLEIAKLFQGWPPSQVVTLTIYEAELEDESKEALLTWSGRVLGSTISGSVATLRCESLYTGLRRNGVKRRYQYGCPHTLYGPMCGANKAAATRSTTVAQTSGAEVTLAEGWTAGTPVGKFVGGYVSWTRGDGRTELLSVLKAISETTLLLSGRPRELDPGSDIDVVLGCEHTTEDCRSLHNNAPNFGGCAFIPTENPIGIKNIF